MAAPTIAILGAGSYAPPTVLTNAELARRVDTSDEWILTRTGIRERRIAGPRLADLRSRHRRRPCRTSRCRPHRG